MDTMTRTPPRQAAAGRLYKIALCASDHTLTAFRQALAQRGLIYERAPWGADIQPQDVPTIAVSFREAVLPDIGGSDRELAVILLDRIDSTLD
jgi:hypothetical protein